MAAGVRGRPSRRATATISPDRRGPGSSTSTLRANDGQRTALEGIFIGRWGGDAATHFPWGWKASELVAVRAVAIDVDHTRRRQWLRIR
jgi:hypothetical protein